MIREARWDNDYWQLMAIGQTFLAESHQQSLTWDPEAAHAFFWQALQDPGTDMLVAATDNGTVVGYAIMRTVQEVTVEKIAYIVSFYVLPDYRGELHSWRLLKNLQDYAIERGAKFLYAASTAGMNDNGATLQAFRRMFEKAGMTYLGDFFVQDLT